MQSLHSSALRSALLLSGALFLACSEGFEPSPDTGVMTGSGGIAPGAGGSAVASATGGLASITGGSAAASGGSSASEPQPSGGVAAATGGVAATAGTNGGKVSGSGGSGDMPRSLPDALRRADSMDGVLLREAYPSEPAKKLGYDATKASGLDLIQASNLALTEPELARLAEQGVVIARERMFPSFSYGYKSIYAADLPVFVSADSILDAVHRTFDSLLERAEERLLLTELDALLENMRQRIPEVISDPELARDAELYLLVAEQLARPLVLGSDSPPPLAPVTDLDPSKVAELVALAQAANGRQSVELFGLRRDEDFSQFKPRGHYTDSERLRAYFKAMMWLGRVDLRLVETNPDGSQTFHRRNFDVAVTLRRLMDAEQYQRWRNIDALIGAFVGERDSMSPEELDGLLAALGASADSELGELGDERIHAEIISGGWGEQRIASRILIEGPGAGPEPLPRDRSFLIFGQRYTVDSHTFVNTTHDRVDSRMLPDPLDAAFAALRNDSALSLLSPDLDNAAYARGLARTRVLVDAHDEQYWQSSAYTRWLRSLSLLSPAPDQDLSGIVPTVAWQRRILNTQLGSWAQLRHDTILYTKQSYTNVSQCEFPDAYVDPYPAFYRELAGLAEQVASVTRTLPETYVDPWANGVELKTSIDGWSELFVSVMKELELMAENQRTGTPHSQEQLDFINAGVDFGVTNTCGRTTYHSQQGWYLKLFAFLEDAIEYDPTIADVHTQPSDLGGADVGRILHVGTGMPRLMVVTANTCMGPRAYAGLSFSYGELVTDGWQRLTDPEWKKHIEQGFPDPEWTAPLLGAPASAQ